MEDYRNPKLIVETAKLQKGSITWRSPSNIAIVKYWGKYGIQLPRNPSISFTLKNAYTETKMEYSPKKGADDGISLDFYFDGEMKPDFKSKVLKFFNSLIEIFPFIKQLDFVIHSKNSFPHSAGIASSASSMSALALCLCSLEDELFGTLTDDSAFRQKASYISRLGSGSASRSIYPSMAVWGESGEVEGSSNLFAVSHSDHIHEIFKSFHDDILIVSKGEKSVSSRVGHAMMESNLYAAKRYEQAKKNFHNLLFALKNGDVKTFGRIAESEALTLHALMMTSNPPYILMRPNTLKIIEIIQQYRKDTDSPIFFSLDAGPNLHLLYPEEIKESVHSFIEKELIQYCEEGKWISDKVGEGPEQL